MNQVSSYLAHSPTHISNPRSYQAHSQAASEMSQYPQYQSQPAMPTSASSYGGQYPSQYYGGVTSPQSITQPVSTSMTMGNQLAPLPNLQMPAHAGYGSSSHGQSYQPQQQQQQPQQSQQPQHQQQSHQQQEPAFDPTGQLQPVGAKPRVTATLWEDEGSLCFQVEAKGVCVARREDNHFINGTKLVNVAGMTRGRRDGILKSEKTRHVVKIGPMHLKGVWIPFERALDFANREKITDLLYPLFVHNISQLLYHPQNADRRSTGALERKNRDRPATTLGGGPPSAGLHHQLSGQMSAQSPHSIAPHPTLNRPSIDRAHTFPTPPTSASAVAPQSGPYDWGSQSMSSAVQTSQPLAIDTGLSNARSMPSTPATTPPGNSMQNMQSYQSNGSYDASRTVYSGAPQTPGQYATQQQNLARFGAPMQPHGYSKNEMGPPSRGNMSGSDEHADIKTEPYRHTHSSEQTGHDTDDGEPGQEADYSQDHSTSYSATRGPFNYTPTSTISSMTGEHGPMVSEQVDSSPHQSGSGRVTPRTAVSQSNWQTGYNTPPRSGTSSSLYGALDSRGSLVNGHNVDYNSSYSINGNVSTKRGREDDEDYKSHAMNGETLDSIKRRKSGREGSIGGSSGMPFNYGNRQNSAIMQTAHR